MSQPPQIVYVERAPKRTSCLTWLAAIVLIPVALVATCASVGSIGGGGGTPVDASGLPDQVMTPAPQKPKPGDLWIGEELNAIKLGAKARKGGFGNVLLVDLTLENTSPYPVQDIHVRASVRGESGRRVAYLTYTATIVLKPGEKRTIKEANFGRIPQQAAQVVYAVLNCQVAE